MAQANVNAVITADDRASSVIRGVGASFGKLAGAFAVGNLAAQGVTRAFDAMTSAGRNALKSAADFEQTRIGLENMLGSADKARDLLGKISDFAAKTPFEFPELAQSTRMLVAFGFSAKDAYEGMQTLGDVASAVGANITDLSYLYGTLRAQGRAYTVDIKQFATRGIPIYEYLGKVLNASSKEVAKLVEQGKVGFPQVEKAFKLMTAAGGQFHGAMAKQSKSLNGLFSTLKDTFGQVARALFGITTQGDVVAGSLFDRMRNSVSGLINVLNSNLPAIQAFFTNFVNGIIRVAQQIGAYLGPKIIALKNNLVQLLPILLPIVQAIGVGLVIAVGKVLDLINFLAAALVRVRNWFSSNAQVITVLKIALATVMIPLRQLWGVIQAELLPALKKLWQQVGPVLGPALKIIGAVILGVVIVAIVALATVLKIAIKVISFIINVIARFIAIVRAVVGPAMAFYKAIYDRIIRPIKNAITWIGKIINKFNSIKNTITTALSGIYDTITSPFRDAFEWIISKANDVKTAISNLSPGKIGGKILKFATGGLLGHATGTSFAAGGPVMVGEQGPEIVNLPRGSQVVPHNSVKQGGGSSIVNINVQAGAFMGSQQDARKYAVIIANALKDYAKMNGTTAAAILEGN